MSQPPAPGEMPRNLKNWELLRQKGKGRFILITGVLFYGVPMFVIMTFFVNVASHQTQVMPEAMRVAISLVIWLLGGAVFGWIMWRLNESRYQKFLARQAAANSASSPSA